MNKVTTQQLNKLRTLLASTSGKPDYELRAIFSHFLQILDDIDSFSQFKRDISMKLSSFDYRTDKSYAANEIKALMTSAIDYYSNSL